MSEVSTTLPDSHPRLEIAVSPFDFPGTLEEARETARGRKVLELYERARDIDMEIDANVESTIRFHKSDVFAMAHPPEDMSVMFGMIHWAFIRRGQIMVIQGLATDRPYERRGVGSHLLRYARQQAVGCTAIHLTALPGAVGFYERFGFEKVSSHVLPSMELALPEAAPTEPLHVT